jgi:hypothetical protein
VEAIAIIRKRDVGDSIPTPAYPDSMPNLVDQPTLSTVVTAWEAEKARGAWSVKVRNDYLAWMLFFQQIAGDRPLGNYSKEDARTFKSVLLKLPANWRKKPAIKDLSVLEAIKKAETRDCPHEYHDLKQGHW